MREPARLREEGASALERALLEAGTSYKSSGSARAKTLSALGLAGSATLLAGATQAAPLSSVAKLTWSKLLLGLSAVGAVAAVPVGYYAWHHGRAARQDSMAPLAAEAPPPTPAIALPPPAVASAVALPPPAAESTQRAGVRTTPGTITLARELSSLDTARAMLARGDAAAALTRLDAYARAYPHGRLALEAEVLRIDALEQSGRTTAARTRAELFLRHHPHSVLAARVRARLGT
ncbi:MAG TPA: hypothetical protein VHG72_12465 [Polyangia bacterium]|nr:hypothetical protein [Polyangia bacterium]